MTPVEARSTTHQAWVWHDSGPPWPGTAEAGALKEIGMVRDEWWGWWLLDDCMVGLATGETNMEQRVVGPYWLCPWRAGWPTWLPGRLDIGPVSW